MEQTREIYWNVGHWVVIPMYALVALTAGVLIWAFLARYRVWRQSKSLDRRDHLVSRIARALADALDQRQVLRVAAGGIPHALFFWGIIVLFIGTLLVMAQADFTDLLFGVQFLQGDFYLWFSMFTDVAGILAICALATLAVRRYIVRPSSLETGLSDYLLHGLLFAVLVTGFLVEGVRMAATELQANPALAQWSPVGRLTATAFDGVDDATLLTVHEALWWVHLSLVFGLLIAIPFTKLRHVFLTPLNYVFVPREEKGSLPSLDLEDETIEQYGAAHTSDLTWKDLYDADACTSCARCQDRCPAYLSGKPLSPMKIVKEIGSTAFQNPQGDLVEALDSDALWACTTCRACQEICPADIEHVNKIIEVRRNMVLTNGEFPDDQVRTQADALEINGNPFGLPRADRAAWAAGLPVVIGGADGPVDVLYFAGCYASFDQRNQKVARSFVELCTSAGVTVGLLGSDERCCGEPLRKLGNEYVYQMLAAENIEAIEASGASTVVTTCPHCFNTLKRDYRDLGLKMPVDHATRFVQNLVRDGRLEIRDEAFSCTYHDSCYLGRYQDIFEEPRNLIAAAGGSLVEMAGHGRDSFCCGAGGGRILADERIGTRISTLRLDQALQTDADLLVSSCPFCLSMFEDAIGAAECEERLRAVDLLEVLRGRLVGDDGSPSKDERSVGVAVG
jgi:Fe-S oxidoreductase/nitrate reductase gamma subunit